MTRPSEIPPKGSLKNTSSLQPFHRKSISPTHGRSKLINLWLDSVLSFTTFNLKGSFELKLVSCLRGSFSSASITLIKHVPSEWKITHWIYDAVTLFIYFLTENLKVSFIVLRKLLSNPLFFFFGTNIQNILRSHLVFTCLWIPQFDR